MNIDVLNDIKRYAVAKLRIANGGSGEVSDSGDTAIISAIDGQKRTITITIDVK